MSKRYRAINGHWYRKARVARTRTRELQIAFLNCFFFGKPMPPYLRRIARRELGHRVTTPPVSIPPIAAIGTQPPHKMTRPRATMMAPTE